MATSTQAACAQRRSKARLCSTASLLISLAAAAAAAAAELGQLGQQPQQPACMGYSGGPVDWWLLLKYPSGTAAGLLEGELLRGAIFLTPTPTSAAAAAAVQHGRAHVSSEEGWRLGVGVNDPAGPLRATLAAAGAAAAAAPAAASVDADRLSGHSGGMSGAGAGSSSNSSSSSINVRGYVMYNDADPEGVEHWAGAHAKGVLVLGPEGGAWVTHSFPRYPGRPPRAAAAHTTAAAPPPGSRCCAASWALGWMVRGAKAAAAGLGLSEWAQAALEWALGGEGDSGTGGAGSGSSGGGGAGSGGTEGDWDVVQPPQTVFGQHALCLSLPAEAVEAVAAGLLLARVYVYDYVLPPDLAQRYDTVRQLIDGSVGGWGAPGQQARADVGSASGGGGGGWWHAGLAISRRVLGRPAAGQQLRQQAWGQPQPAPAHVAPAANTSVQQLSTVGGMRWLHVAKSPDHTVPFHEEVLEPLLGAAAMAWETWRVGPSLPSQCPPDTQYGSLNVRRLAFPPPGAAGAAASKAAGAAGAEAAEAAQVAAGAWVGEGVGWDSLKDHGKWGVSFTSVDMRQRGVSGPGAGQAEQGGEGVATPRGDAAAAVMPQPGVACFGDLNRQPSQRFRGGGYVCCSGSNSSAAGSGSSSSSRGGGGADRGEQGGGAGRLWAAMRALVAEVEPCAPAARAWSKS